MASAPWSHFGSKARDAYRYPAPHFRLVVEPFSGSARYAFHHAVGHDVWVNDLDPETFQRWSFLTDAGAAARVSEHWPDYVRPGDTLRDLFGGTASVPGLMDLAVGYATVGRGGTPTPKTTRITPFAAGRWPTRRMVLSLIERVRRWKRTNHDYRELPNVEATWFIDAPYSSLTLGGRYRHGAQRLDFHELAEWCLSRRGQVIVCEAAGATWLPFGEFPVSRQGFHTRAGTSANRRGAIFHRSPYSALSSSTLTSGLAPLSDSPDIPDTSRPPSTGQRCQLPNTITHGDAEVVLQDLPAESVQLVFTSPPYYNARPEYADYPTYDDYLLKLRKVFRNVHRVLEDGRFFVINISPILVRRQNRQQASQRLAIPFDVHRLFTDEGFDFIDDILWVKPEGAGWATGRGRRFAADRNPLQYKPVPVTEYVLVYRKRTDKLIDWHLRNHPDPQAVRLSKIEDGYERTNIWKITPAHSKEHPAIFPRELAAKVIRYYSFVNDVVLDPFAGTGTVGAAAIACSRRFALIEQNPVYVELIRRNSRAWLGERGRLTIGNSMFTDCEIGENNGNETSDAACG